MARAKHLPVKCSVENCQYWNDNFCQADQIEVATIQRAPNKAGRGDEEIGSLEKQDKADYSAETQCVTFRPKGIRIE